MLGTQGGVGIVMVRAQDVRALRAQAAALLAAVDALLYRVDPSAVPPAAGDCCPRCGSDDLAEADDCQVCGNCNANIRDGEVVA